DRPSASHPGRAGLQHQSRGRSVPHQTQQPEGHGRFDRRCRRRVPARVRAEDRQRSRFRGIAVTGTRGIARLGLLAAAVLLGGCAYYNGMYNTSRMAKSARKAERDGRAFEAQGYWGQVVTKADSLVVRHPQSKYADQATVLRGLALARLNQCPEAVGS